MENIRTVSILLGIIFILTILNFNFYYTGSFAYPKDSTPMNYTLVLLPSALLVISFLIFERLKKYLPKSDIVLVGELHAGSYGFGYESKELYEKQLYETLKLMDETKPDYVFVEMTEDDILKKENSDPVLKKSKEIKAKVVPLEDDARTFSLAESVTKKYSLVEELNVVLDFERRLKYPDKYPDALQTLNKKLKEYPKLRKILNADEVNEGNIGQVVAHLEEGHKTLRQEIDAYNEMEGMNPSTIYEDRERRWSHLIARHHHWNPNAKFLIVVGDGHVNGDKTAFPRLLKEYGLRYEKVSSVERARMELRKIEERLDEG